MPAEEDDLGSRVLAAVCVEDAGLVVLLEQQRDLPWLLENLHAAAGPRLRGRTADAQLEIGERLRRAAHVLGVVEPLGARLRRVRQLPVRRIDDPLRRT